MIPLRLIAQFDSSAIRLRAEFDSTLSLAAEFDTSVTHLRAEMDGPTRFRTDQGDQIITDDQGGATGTRPDVLDTT